MQLSKYQENIVDAFKNTKDNLFINAFAGCVDCDTEYFNGTEWVRISDYKEGDKVLQYNIDTKEASLSKPILYHKYPCEKLWHFETKYGLDQCLCDNHNLLCYTHLKANNLKFIKFSDFLLQHKKSPNGYHGTFETVFKYSGNGIDLTDEQIRVMVAVIADGTFCYVSEEDWDSYFRCRFHLKKDRKKNRLRKLFQEANYKWTERQSSAQGYTDFYIDAPRREKVFTKDYWYNCNQHQLEIICDEVSYWDGDFSLVGSSKRRFFTNVKETADFIQFVYSACGYRSTIKVLNRVGKSHKVEDKEYNYKTIEYSVLATKRNRVGMTRRTDLGKDKVEITPYQTKDGYKYCFTMPLGTLILRRNNKIFVTGNCGKTYMLLELSKYINIYSVFIAFNKSIQEEIKIKINNPKFKSYTFNGLGYQIMMKNWEDEQNKLYLENPLYQKKTLTIDAFKSNELASLVCNEREGVLKLYFMDSSEDIDEDDQYMSFLNDLAHLFDLCRQRMVNFSDEEGIYQTIEFYDLFSQLSDIPSEIPEMLNKMFELDIEWANEGKIDFIDQLFITYFKVMQKQWTVPYWNQFENVLVDECLSGDTYITILDEFTQKEKRIKLKTLYKIYSNKTKLLAKSYNHKKNIFEFKKILNVKKHEKRDVFKIKTEGLNVIKATDNHRFLTQRGYVEVKDLIIGKDVLCLDNIENQKTKYILNDDQLQVALASAIGDGHLEKRSKFNTYRLKFTHGEKQLEYLKFKINLFHAHEEYETKSGYCDNKIYSSSTKTFLLFDDLWKLMENIDERFLAIWYQDDGSAFYDKKGNLRSCRIACNNLRESQVDFLIDIIFKKYNINLIKFKEKEKYWSINININDSIKFLKLIAPYMHPDLAYKNIFFDKNNLYKWNNQLNTYGGNFISKIEYWGKENVYDIEVEDNHNFVCCSTLHSTGMISHNCQDLSRLQQLFISLIRRPKGRIIAVGDKFQSVYSFAGSDCNSIDTLQRLYQLKEYPLPVNYRCPQKHLRYVNKEFNIPIQPRDDAPEGTMKSIDYESLPNFVTKGDCIISRKNSDLCSAALMLLENDKSVYIRDEKLVDRLIAKIMNIKNSINSLEDMEEYLSVLRTEQENAITKRTQKLIEKGVVDNEQVEKVTFSDNAIDLLDCVEILLEKYKEKNKRKGDFSSFINYIRQMLNTTEKKGAIELTSIHQAKGKEWDRVFILNNAKVFRELAKTADQAQQESNLSYVALTRSKDTLFLVKPQRNNDDDDENDD